MNKYKLVPMEPTADMVIAGEDAWDAQLDKRLFAKYDGEAFADYPSEETHELCSRVAYRAMLAASPAVQMEPVAWVTEDTVDGQTVNGKPRRIWWENNEGVGMLIYTTPQSAEQQPAPDASALVEALESLIKGYVGLLEAGKDRITSLGGDCDPVPVMERNDPWLRDARAALAAHRKGSGCLND